MKLARAARKCRSVAETIMWQFLRDSRTGFKFRRERPVTNRYRLDFFCREAMVAVEMDGEQHNATRDEERDLELAGMGVLTYRIPNRRFFNLDAEPYRNDINEGIRLCEERSGRKAFSDPNPGRMAAPSPPAPLPRRGEGG